MCNFDSPLSGSNIMWAARGKSSAPKVAPLVGWVDRPCNILAGHRKILYVPAGQCAFRSFKEAYEGQGVSNGPMQESLTSNSIIGLTLAELIFEHRSVWRPLEPKWQRISLIQEGLQ